MTDADSGAVTGIALTGTTGGGTWLYSIDGGSNWLAVGPVTDSSARVLAADANTRLFYQPAANAFGTETITFHAWDQTDGSANGTASIDASINGGATAFSSATDTADITINSVNDAPVLTGVGPDHASSTEQIFAQLDSAAAVSDAELDALNGGNGDYSGAYVYITRIVGGFPAPNDDDAFGIDTAGASFTLAGNGDLQFGGLTFANFDGSAGTGAIYFTSDATPATTALVNEALSRLTYANQNDNPPASLDLAYTFIDGDGTSGNQGSGGPKDSFKVLTIDITGTNDAPTLTGLDDVTFAENTVNAAPQVIDAAVVFDDADSANLNGGNLTVVYSTGGTAQDQLSFQNVGGITVSGSTVSFGGNPIGTIAGGSGGTSLVVTFNSASATPTAVDALIQALSYQNTSDEPNATRTISITVNDGDGGTSAAATSVITVTAENDVPVFANLGGASHPSFTEGGSSVVLDNNATVSDVELNAAGNYGGATLTLARNGGANPDDAFAGTGTLDLSDGNGNGENVSLDGGTTFVGTYTNPGDGTFSVTFNSSATAANVAAVMQQIVYANSSDNPPASVQIDFAFSDGNGDPGGQAQGPGPTPGIGTGSVTVDITPVNDAPVLFNAAPVAVYAPGTAGTPLSPGVVASDVDSQNLVGATVSITAGLFAGDQFSVNLPTDGGGHFQLGEEFGNVVTNISVASNSGGVLTLQGTDTPSHYQSVLQAVVYSSSSPDPSNPNPTRTIEWQLNDGASVNNLSTVSPDQATTLLHFDFAPALDLDQSAAGNNFATSFTENGVPVAIADTDVTITDSDTTEMSSAQIVLLNAQASDSLTIGTLPPEISGSVDTSTPGQITVFLGGAASPAAYQTALQQVFFSNTSDNPSTTPRDIAVTINDGEVDSNTAHTTVTVNAVNDAPVNTVPGAQSVNEDTNLAIAGLSMADVDAGPNNLPMTTTLAVAHGTLTVASAGGAVVGGSGSATVTLNGTQAQINTTLSAAGNLIYRGLQDFNGPPTP